MSKSDIFTVIDYSTLDEVDDIGSKGVYLKISADGVELRLLRDYISQEKLDKHRKILESQGWIFKEIEFDEYSICFVKKFGGDDND